MSKLFALILFLAAPSAAQPSFEERKLQIVEAYAQPKGSADYGDRKSVV